MRSLTEIMFGACLLTLTGCGIGGEQALWAEEDEVAVCDRVGALGLTQEEMQAPAGSPANIRGSAKMTDLENECMAQWRRNNPNIVAAAQAYKDSADPNYVEPDSEVEIFNQYGTYLGTTSSYSYGNTTRVFLP